MMVIYDGKRLYLESRGYCTLEECRGINIEFFEKTVSQEIQRANKHFNNNIARVRVRSVKRLKREREREPSSAENDNNYRRASPEGSVVITSYLAQPRKD